MHTTTKEKSTGRLVPVRRQMVIPAIRSTISQHACLVAACSWRICSVPKALGQEHQGNCEGQKLIKLNQIWAPHSQVDTCMTGRLGTNLTHVTSVHQGQSAGTDLSILGPVAQHSCSMGAVHTFSACKAPGVMSYETR